MTTATKTYTETKHIPFVTVFATKHENTAKIMTLKHHWLYMICALD
jgi:hypothetical protein